MKNYNLQWPDENEHCFQLTTIFGNGMVTAVRTEVLLSMVAGSLELSVVQKEVSELLKGRILVGHALHHDLKVNTLEGRPLVVTEQLFISSIPQALFLSHPSKDTRDTSGYKPFRVIAKVCEVNNMSEWYKPRDCVYVLLF